MTDSGNFCTRSATRRSRIAMSCRTAELGVGMDVPRRGSSARAKTCRARIKSAHPHPRGPRSRGWGCALLILRSEEHTSELQSRQYLVCRLLLEKKKKRIKRV